MAFRTAAALALLLAAVPVVARAQTLQRLTVQSFALSSDTLRPQVDVPFHLTVALHVRENVPEVQNIELPVLAQLELLGDERQTVSTPQGTQYRETIAVVAHSAGSIVISPATLQAVDARDGKPKQWYSNGLTLHAGVPAGEILRNGGMALLAGAVLLLRVLLVVVGVAGVVLLIVLLRRRPQPAPLVAPPTPPPQPQTAAQRIADALVVLRAERTRAAAVRVRAAVWRMLGASEGETLSDVMRRPGTGEEPVRSLLIALERSAFTYDADLEAAISDACTALERYAEAIT